MVVVTLQGGLGNQMFQYAACRALAKHHNCKLLLDLSMLPGTAAANKEITHRQYELGLFKNIDTSGVPSHILQSFLSLSKKNKLLKRLNLPYKKKYMEPAFSFDAGFFLQRPPVLLKGYFQSEKYFSSIKDTIRQAFSFPALATNDVNIPVLQQIQNSHSVSVHVRRADYVNDPAIYAVHGICSIDYYKKAFDYMQQQFEKAVFVFFSDDPAWVQHTFLSYLPGSFIVTNNHAADSWKDMCLMSSCKHHIIANSSFSWWGAWLNSSPDKKVIAPKSWFADTAKNETTTDLIPENWTRL